MPKLDPPRDGLRGFLKRRFAAQFQHYAGLKYDVYYPGRQRSVRISGRDFRSYLQGGKSVEMECHHFSFLHNKEAHLIGNTLFVSRAVLTLLEDPESCGPVFDSLIILIH